MYYVIKVEYRTMSKSMNVGKQSGRNVNNQSMWGKKNYGMTAAML